MRAWGGLTSRSSSKFFIVQSGISELSHPDLAALDDLGQRSPGGCSRVTGARRAGCDVASSRPAQRSISRRERPMANGTNVPTVVLVHGGFADASFWTPVIQELQARALPVLAPPNPLRGLAGDAEYIASFVNQIEGPVLLVGHSYGGAVISVAGAAADNVVG